MSLQNQALVPDDGAIRPSQLILCSEQVKEDEDVAPTQLYFPWVLPIENGLSALPPNPDPQAFVSEAVFCDWCSEDVRDEIVYFYRGYLICDQCCWRESEAGGW